MEKQSAEDNAKKAALNANFIRKKTENEERERIDAERIAKFEEEVRLNQEAKRITKLQDESEMMETDNRERVAVDVHMHSIPYVQHNLTSSTQNSNQWSFDAPVFSIPSDTSVLPDRLSSLNRLLEEVDSSLSHGTEDRLVDLLADTGRVPLSQIVQVTSVPHEHSQEQMEINTTVTKPCDRRAVIFMKQPISQLVEDSLISDEFFEVGIEDAKTMQRDLHEQVRLQTQRAILPKSYVDKKNKEAKISSYKNTVIRISVDKSGHYLQAQFHSTEPGEYCSKNIYYELVYYFSDPVFNLDLLTVCEYHEADKFSSDWFVLLCQNKVAKYKLQHF
uniref:UBX domain-containing protein n=1 Tax=Heterorhabditis bacteriophora TaxID=37862 RepID=A0A1I7XM76_HETBA